MDIALTTCVPSKIFGDFHFRFFKYLPAVAIWAVRADFKFASGRAAIIKRAENRSEWLRLGVRLFQVRRLAVPGRAASE